MKKLLIFLKSKRLKYSKISQGNKRHNPYYYHQFPKRNSGKFCPKILKWFAGNVISYKALTIATWSQFIIGTKSFVDMP